MSDPRAAAPESPFVGYVGIVTRGVALVVDAICIDLSALILGGAVKLLLSLAGTDGKISVGVIVAGGFVWAVIWAGAYFVGFWTITGQTPGARLMGFHVVTRGDFQRVSWKRASRRAVGFYLAAIPLGIGFLPVLVDDERRGWHDRLAGTVVRWAPADWERPARWRRRERGNTPEGSLDAS